MKTKLICRAAFTLVEIMIVVAIIGLLAAIAIPNLAKARIQTQKTTCMLNLRSIYGAKQTWAAEVRKAGSDVPNDTHLFGPALYIKEKPNCPANGTYMLDAVDQNPICSVTDHTI